jgi:hypothetical protein
MTMHPKNAGLRGAGFPTEELGPPASKPPEGQVLP